MPKEEEARRSGGELKVGVRRRKRHPEILGQYLDRGADKERFNQSTVNRDQG